MRNLFISLIVCCIIITGISCIKNDPVVANIGADQKITLSEFQESFKASVKKAEKDTTTLDDLKFHLNTLIDKKIKMAAALQMDLDKDKTFQEEVENLEKGFILNEILFKKVILDPVIKESMIRDYYNRSGKKLTVRSIFIKKSPVDSAGIDQGREKAHKVRKEISEGSSFLASARMYSDDSKTALNGGLQRDLLYSKPKDAFQKAAFSGRTGELSQVIEGANGYYIIRVEEIEPIKQKPYEEERKGITERLRGVYGKEIQEQVKTYFTEMPKKLKYHYNETILDSLASLFSIAQSIPLDSLKTMSQGIGEEILLTAVDTSMTVNQFMKGIDPRKIASYQEKDRVKQQIEANLRMHHLYKIALMDKLNKHPEVVQKITELMEKKLPSMVVEKAVYDSIKEPSDAEITQWYDMHYAEKFSFPEKRSIREILVSDEELANELVQRIESGEDIEKLAREHTERTSKKNNGGLLEEFSKSSYGKIGEEAFKLSIGDIAGPVKIGRQFSVIKLVDIISKPRPFESVQRLVKQDLIDNIRKEKLEAWLEQQKQSMEILIHEKVLANAL